ncbi:hypothetical protein [Komagataeibacter xylinus]|uniref:hypothetical protein n=1 Tax=Komagataeibacter xylinus TaxID=28448 RepID=UPI0010308FD5|nr:hypothetical protein [Komagataeibacter xylinus]
MKVCKNGLDENILELFTAPFDDHDFFLHATHFVTVEQALATIGILNPDFFEYRRLYFMEKLTNQTIHRRK